MELKEKIIAEINELFLDRKITDAEKIKLLDDIQYEAEKLIMLLKGE